MRLGLARDWLTEGRFLTQEVGEPPAPLSNTMCPICGRSHDGALPPLGGGGLNQTTTTTDNIVESITSNGRSWVMDGVRGQPAVITYSFLDTLPSNFQASQYPGFTGFSAQHREATRRAFDAWAQVSGVTFVEVPASVGGMIQLGLHNFTGTSFAGFAGYASYPSASPYWQTDAVLMMNLENYAGDASMDPGTGGFQVLLHEIGHNLGLSHPHDVSVRLVTDLDHTQYTVMSYNWRLPFMTAPGEGDRLAVQSLYGTEEAEQASPVTWTLNRNTWTIVWQGGAGNDVISGTNLAETLTGGAGADRINGGEGDDLIIADIADTRLSGNEGTDTLDLSGFATAVNLDMHTSSGVADYEGRLVVSGHTMALSAFENIVGTAGNDTIGGTWWAAGTLSGGDGNDTITLRAGNSRADGGVGNDAITANGTASTLIGGLGTDTLTGWGANSLLEGGDGNDTLAVNGTGSVGEGGLGNDTLTGGASSIILRGGAGDDTYDLGSGSNVTVTELADGGTDTIVLRGSTAFTLPDHVEAARGSSSFTSINVTGNGLNNTLTGGSSSDTLSGGAGDDTLTGGGGFDRLIGGDGTDTAVMGFDTAAMQVVRLAGELFVRNRNSTGTGSFLTGVEQVRLSDGSTQQTAALTQAATDLAYNWRTEWTTGQPLSDSIGVLSSFSRSSSITFNGNTGYAEQLVLDDYGTHVQVRDFETVTGGAGADRVTLTGTTNTIALSGIETVTGSAGRDVISLLADAGTRTITGGDGYDVVILAGRRADYTITRSGTSVTVASSTGTSTLTGVERLNFADATEVVSLPAWQNQAGTLAASSGAQSFTVRQETIPETVEPGRGVVASRVTINGQIVQNLRRGWRVATVADIDGNGKQEIFFFGMDSIQGLGSGFGATWEIGASGTVERAQVQFGMGRPGWEVAGAANINGIAGDEIIWQNTLTGIKAIWTDANRDGTIDGGYGLDALGTDPAERIVGTADLDRDGLVELVLFHDVTGRFRVFEATGVANGSVTLALQREFDSHTALTDHASQQNATLRLFDVFAPTT